MLKKYIKKLPFYPYINNIFRNIKKRSRHPIQKVKPANGFNFVHLGTEYGGWTFVDEEVLIGSTIISAGLGEDASFDVEFASRYNAKVIIVDPTPRAISHFNEIQGSIGYPSTEKYFNTGQEPICAYDLTKIHKGSLTLVAKALWNVDTQIKFFEPKNPEHVSHSIVNFQNEYSKNTRSINVEAITLETLLFELNLDPSEIPLIKLDIEGAEIEVLTRCMDVGIFPRQILVEFDELNIPSAKGFARVSETDSLLTNNGYKLIMTDGNSDFLYYR